MVATPLPLEYPERRARILSLYTFTWHALLCAVVNWRFQQFRTELNQMVEAERTIFEPELYFWVVQVLQ